MSVEAQVVQIKDVPVGGAIGYGAAFVARYDTRIAILNVGYADGYLRLLGKRGHAKAGGRSCPILGRISMDLMAVEVPQAGTLRRIQLLDDGERSETEEQLEAVDVQEGDWLALKFRLSDLAGELSQYELLTTLGSRFERHWT